MLMLMLIQLHRSLVSLQLSNTTMALLDPIPSSSSVSPSSVTGGNTQGFAAELDKTKKYCCQC